MSCAATFEAYALRAIGYGERLLELEPLSDGAIASVDDSSADEHSITPSGRFRLTRRTCFVSRSLEILQRSRCARRDLSDCFFCGRTGT